MLPPLNPTIRPLAGNNLGSEPGASGPSSAPKGEAQAIPKQLAAFSGAGGRQISRANANALAAKGTAGRGLVAQPVGEGGDLGGGVEALRQRKSRCTGSSDRPTPDAPNRHQTPRSDLRGGQSKCPLGVDHGTSSKAQWPGPEHFQERAHEQDSAYLKPAQS